MKVCGKRKDGACGHHKRPLSSPRIERIGARDLSLSNGLDLLGYVPCQRKFCCSARQFTC